MPCCFAYAPTSPILAGFRHTITYYIDRVYSQTFFDIIRDFITDYYRVYMPDFFQYRFRDTITDYIIFSLEILALAGPSVPTCC